MYNNVFIYLLSNMTFHKHKFVIEYMLLVFIVKCIMQSLQLGQFGLDLFIQVFVFLRLYFKCRLSTLTVLLVLYLIRVLKYSAT